MSCIYEQELLSPESPVLTDDVLPRILKRSLYVHLLLSARYAVQGIVMEP